MADDGVQYEFKSVQAVRGTEARSMAKWQKDGWEYVDQSQGSLRTTLNFRRVKPKTFSGYLMESVTAFRGLQPKTQLALAGSAAAILVAGTIGIVVGTQAGGDSSEPSAASATRSDDPSEEPTADPVAEVTEPAAATYSYEGPKYEIVSIDEDLGPAELSQYWVYTSKFDYSTDAYKDQIKLIITDIARNAKTAKVYVEVVTDKEIAEAEAVSTYESFVEEHGEDYANNTIPKKEKKGWAASYTGGIDSGTNEPSDSDDAYEVIWRIGSANPEFETWKPQVATS